MRIDRASPRAECRILGWCGSTSRVRRSQCSIAGAYPSGSLLSGVAPAIDRLADDARHVHLADADAVADLRLGEILGEAEPQHLAFALAEHPHQALDGRRVLGHGEAGILDSVGRAEAVALLVLLARAVERDRTVGTGRLARLEHLLDRRPGALGDLGGGGRAAELARELGADRFEL